MTEFMFLFRTTSDEQHQAMGTPEQAQRSMQVWLDWVRGLETAGHLKNPGQPLDPSGKVVRGDRVVTDGPYVEAKDIVLGYMVIAARDLAQAVDLAHGCPMLGGHATVEIRPIRQMS